MFILFNIGCIECGVTSDVVGIFTSEDVANHIAKSLSDTHGWREGGENHFEVFKTPVVNVINDKYFTESDAENVKQIQEKL